jgi:hypothetical protein
MTELLEQAIARLKTLPTNQQDAIPSSYPFEEARAGCACPKGLGARRMVVKGIVTLILEELRDDR